MEKEIKLKTYDKKKEKKCIDNKAVMCLVHRAGRKNGICSCDISWSHVCLCIWAWYFLFSRDFLIGVSYARLFFFFDISSPNSKWNIFTSQTSSIANCRRKFITFFAHRAYRFGCCVMLTKLWCHMHAHTFLVNPNQLYLLNFISMLIYAHSIGWAFSLVSLFHTFSHFWTRSASAALYSVALIMISTWFTWFAQMKFIFIEANFVYFTFSAWDFSLISHH